MIIHLTIDKVEWTQFLMSIQVIMVQTVTPTIASSQTQALNTQTMMKMNKKCNMNLEDQQVLYQIQARMKSPKSIGQDYTVKSLLT